MPHYSFVILCHNQWELTRQAITTLNESISHYHKKKGIELIVVNNGSDDETKIGVQQMKVLLNQEIKIVPVHLEKNMGLIFAINIGFSRCRGEIITLLNNDLVFPNNWFDGIVSTLETSKSVGVAVPFLSYASGPADVNVRFGSLNEMKEFATKFMEDNKNKIIYTERVIGACVSMKRELVSLIGGNDFWFGYGFFDDDDWALRACIAGYKLAIVGSSFVHHIGNATISKHSDATRAAIQANGEKFGKKWNIIGGFDRKKLVETTVYTKEQHFFPLKVEVFDKPFSRSEKFSNKKDIIFVADWSNDRSQWRNKLLEAKAKFLAGGNGQIYLWIPKNYYSVIEIKNEVEKILNKNTSGIHYLYDDVPPIDLLKFLSKYEVFLTVEGDYVNEHMKFLLENSSLEIV
jgi:O-antigen biosynthesis protein